MLTYDGIGHGQFRNSPCARSYIERYLTELKLPVPGTHCPAVFPAAAASTLGAPDLAAPAGRPRH